MNRTVYRVMPNGSMWDVVSEDSVVSTHDSKQPAIETGREHAINSQPSQLVVHRTDGTIEFERTYQDDPFPPRG